MFLFLKYHKINLDIKDIDIKYLRFFDSMNHLEIQTKTRFVLYLEMVMVTCYPSLLLAAIIFPLPLLCRDCLEVSFFEEFQCSTIMYLL